MRVKLTAKHPRPASPSRAPVRPSSPSARKTPRTRDGERPAPEQKAAAPRSGAKPAAPGSAPKRRDGANAKPRSGAAQSAPRARASEHRGADRRTADRRDDDTPRRAPRPSEGHNTRDASAAKERSTRGTGTPRAQGAERRADNAPRRAPRADENRGSRTSDGDRERGARRPSSGRDGGRSFGGATERTRGGPDERKQRTERGDRQDERAPRTERRDRSDERSPRMERGARPAKGAAERTSRDTASNTAGAGARKIARPVKSGASSPGAPAPRRDAASSTRPGPAKAGSREWPARGEARGRPATGNRGDASKRMAAATGTKPTPSRLAKPSISAGAPASRRADTAEHGEGLVRLSKRMSELGLCSRREADEWIENGWVRVDGERIDTLGSRVRPDQHIEVTKDAHAAQSRQVTILLHKPVGYVSGQAEDGYEPAITLVTADNRWENDRATTRFIPSHLRALAPAGRLDIDSTGLLVLTQDGRIAKQLIGEHSSVEKEYLVRVTYGERTTDIDRHFPADQLALLRFGLSLDDTPLKPAKVSWQNGEQLRFVLREGKKRQIRRMCDLVGLHVVGLKRVRMGRVALGALPQGKWRYLLPDEAF